MKRSLLIPLALVACAGCSDLPDAWTLTAPGISVEVRRSPYGFTVHDGAGKVVLSTVAGAAGAAGEGYGPVAWTSGEIQWKAIVSPGYQEMSPVLDPWRDRFSVVDALSTSPRSIELVLEADGGEGSKTRVHVTHALRDSTLRIEARVDGETPRAVAAAFASPADEGFLGFGERFNRTEQRGKDVYAWQEEGGLGKGEKQLSGPNNPWPNGEEMTYYPVPFFISTRGYGFWLDSTWRNEFNLGSAREDAWRVWHIGPRLAFEVYTPIPDDARPWPQHLLDLFTRTVGRPMVPPAWAFGPRRRINVNAQKDGVLEIQRMRDLDLAITAFDDNIHFLPAGSEVGREAELKVWVEAAHRLGYRVNGYFNPYFTQGDQNPLKGQVDEGLAKGHFLHDRTGTPSEVWLISGKLSTVYAVDFSSPEATAWYQRSFQRALDLGYSGWMYDFGEYVQPDVVSSTGMTGEELHDLYPVLYDKAAFDALESGPHKGDWLAFARSGYTGSWRYSPMVWGGNPTASFEDALGLPSVVRAGINMGLSGVPHWGSDIGGFKCVPDGYSAADGEMLARWIQAGALMSNMQDQDACSSSPDSGVKASIFNSPDAQDAWRTYARLHTRLQPYLRTLAAEAARTGAPTMRHLFFEHPDQRALAAVDDAYYFGPSLLVAPVVKRGARERMVPLPSGLYLDWADRALVRGPQATVPAALGKLPLFLRDGHLVPLLDDGIDTLAEEDSPAIVGPGDVAGSYDVVGLVSKETERAAFTLWDGGTLAVRWQGGFTAPAVPAAADEGELSTCASCYLREALASGLTRVRVRYPGGQISAGGLTLDAAVGRPVRFDLYLVD